MSRVFSVNEDDGNLVHETQAEAVVAWLDDEFVQGEPVDDCIRRLCGDGLKVYEFAQASVSDEWIARTVDALAETLQEQFHEEFGNPDSGFDDLGEAACSALRDAVVAHASVTHIWKCELVATHVLTMEQVLEIAKENA